MVPQLGSKQSTTPEKSNHTAAISHKLLYHSRACGSVLLNIWLWKLDFEPARLEEYNVTVHIVCLLRKAIQFSAAKRLVRKYQQDRSRASFSADLASRRAATA